MATETRRPGGPRITDAAFDRRIANRHAMARAAMNGPLADQIGKNLIRLAVHGDAYAAASHMAGLDLDFDPIDVPPGTVCSVCGKSGKLAYDPRISENAGDYVCESCWDPVVRKLAQGYEKPLTSMCPQCGSEDYHMQDPRGYGELPMPGDKTHVCDGCGYEGTQDEFEAAARKFLEEPEDDGKEADAPPLTREAPPSGYPTSEEPMPGTGQPSAARRALPEGHPDRAYASRRAQTAPCEICDEPGARQCESCYGFLCGDCWLDREHFNSHSDVPCEVCQQSKAVACPGCDGMLCFDCFNSPGHADLDKLGRHITGESAPGKRSMDAQTIEEEQQLRDLGWSDVAIQNMSERQIEILLQRKTQNPNPVGRQPELPMAAGRRAQQNPIEPQPAIQEPTTGKPGAGSTRSKTKEVWDADGKFSREVEADGVDDLVRIHRELNNQGLTKTQPQPMQQQGDAAMVESLDPEMQQQGQAWAETSTAPITAACDFVCDLCREPACSHRRAQSGYTDCACRDCFDIAINGDGQPALCGDCQGAGCSIDGDEECQRPDAYGGDEGMGQEGQGLAERAVIGPEAVMAPDDVRTSDSGEEGPEKGDEFGWKPKRKTPSSAPPAGAPVETGVGTPGPMGAAITSREDYKPCSDPASADKPSAVKCADCGEKFDITPDDEWKCPKCGSDDVSSIFGAVLARFADWLEGRRADAPLNSPVSPENRQDEGELFDDTLEAVAGIYTAQKMKLKCQECGKKFKSSSMEPKCPKCGGYDIEPDYDASRSAQSEDPDPIHVTDDFETTLCGKNIIPGSMAYVHRDVVRAFLDPYAASFCRDCLAAIRRPSTPRRSGDVKPAPASHKKAQPIGMPPAAAGMEFERSNERSDGDRVVWDVSWDPEMVDNLSASDIGQQIRSYVIMEVSNAKDIGRPGRNFGFIADPRIEDLDIDAGVASVSFMSSETSAPQLAPAEID